MSGPLLCSRQRAIFFPLKRSCSPRAHCAMASGVCSRMELSLFAVAQSYRQRACRWLAQSIPIKAANCADLLVMFISVYFFAFLLSLLFSRGGSANTLAFIRRRHYCPRPRTGSSSEDSLRMKARPAPLESMVIIVERSALHIRSGPVRALFPQTHSTRSSINLSTMILSAAAELFTASLRRILTPVPLGHE